MTILTEPGLAPDVDEFARDALAGLSREQKAISSKYFYDERGSGLFDEITELDEYYPTRTEMGIMSEKGAEMATLIGPEAMIIEPGAGNGDKAALLLELLDSPAACVLMDISHDYVVDGAEKLQAAFPEVEVLAAHADFSAEFEPPALHHEAARRLIYFPGSTIGNFAPDEARQLLERMSHTAGAGGGLLIGVEFSFTLPFAL